MAKDVLLRCALLSTISAGLLVGCSEAMPGTTRTLGDVKYESAFQAARKVMSQYFSVASADAEAGLITSRPKDLPMPKDILLGGSPRRQVAKLRIDRKDGQLVARASVAVELLGSVLNRRMQTVGEDYDTVPTETPAELEAATTPQQNQSWRVEKYDHAIERAILADLYKELHAQTEQ